MTTLRALDTAIRLAAGNEAISNNEVDGLIKLAKKAVQQSGNPSRTKAAVLERFDAMAKLKYVGDDKRVINKLAEAVESFTGDAKTFSSLGIITHHLESGRSGRTGGSKSGGSKSSGSTVTRTPARKPAAPLRTGGSKSSGSRSGGSKSSGSTVTRTPVRKPATPLRTGGSKSGRTGRSGGSK